MVTTKRTPKPPHIRWMIRRDFPGVLAADREPDAWSESDLATSLHQRNCVGHVAECPRTERVFGYMVYTLTGRPGKGRLTLDRLVVHPDTRGRGAGSVLLARFLKRVVDFRRTPVLPGGWVPGNKRTLPSGPTDDVRFLCGGDVRPDLGVLADCLEEAGCADPSLLGLFRRGGRLAAVVYDYLRPRFVGGG